MRKFICISVLATSLLISSVTAVAEKIHEIHDYCGIGIVNNAYNIIDYKNQSNLDDFWQSLGINSNRQDLSGEPSNNYSDLSPEESWLVSNNIVSRLYTMGVEGIELSNYESTDNCPKTMLYTMLYKSYYGVLESRPLQFNHTSYRNGVYVTDIPNYYETDDTIIDATFSHGDFWLLYSSNVYELYLKDLLDKGLLNKSDLDKKNGAKFLKDYKALTELTIEDAKVKWDNRLGKASFDNDDILGYTNIYSVEDNKICYQEGKPQYFKDEKIFMLDALNIIADFVRYAEKDMSELEAGIVAYKYGINYLDNISDTDKSNIEFLIAKGILDFENPAEFINLYGEFTYEDAVDIMYRVANKEARLDFSEVTLTDAESFWMQEGFYDDEITIKQSTILPTVETITDEYWEQLIKDDNIENNHSDDDNNTTEDADTFIDDLLGLNLFNKYEVQAADMSVFTVVKMFDTSYNYQYKGIAIKELETSDKRPKEFVSYEEHKFESLSSGEDVTMAKIEFSVEARDFDTAVLFVDNNITIQGGVNAVDVNAYTTITENGEKITLIPASVIRSNFLDLSIIEDKVLLNTVTGTNAVILEDEGYALVGNRVIVSDKLMMTDTSEEVYYNLDVICTLLRNTYLSKLTDRELYVCSSLKSEVVTPVISSNGNEIASTYTVKLSLKDSEDSEEFSSTRFYNIDNLNKGNNVLTREFEVKSGEKVKKVYFIVNWEYVVPDVETLSTFLDNDFLGDSKTLTLNDVNNAIYTRPTDKALQEWWDSNISVSNSLANFMYSTSGVEYVKTGYLVPNLVVLRDKTTSDATISSIFTHYGFKLDSVGLKYCRTTTNWWKNYYNASTMSYDYMKALAVANRTCEVYNSAEMTDGYLYDNRYFVTKAGVLYKNLAFDNLMEYKNKSVKIKTRNLKGGATLPENTGFVYNGRNWLYAYTIKMNNKMYYVIQPDFALDEFQNVSIVNTKNYGILITDNSISNANAKTLFHENIRKVNALYEKYFDKEIAPPTSYADSTYLYGASDLRIDNFFSLIYDSDCYYLAGNRIMNGSGNTYVPPEDTVINAYNNAAINCIPLLYVPADKFYFAGENGNYQMFGGTLATALGMNNVFTAGVAQSVIDSIINRSTKTIPINALITGQRVLITDIMFTKTTDENGNPILLSDPIYNTRLVAAMKNSERQYETDVIKRLLFTGVQVDYGGQAYYLSNFIEKGNLGNISNPKENEGVLYYSNGHKYVYLNKEHYNQSVDSLNPKAVCIAIQLGDGLLCRPTNEKQNTYVALMVSSVAADNMVDNIPFFNEELSYSEQLSNYVTVEQSKFNPSSIYLTTRDNFKSMMSKAFAGDLIVVLWMAIFYFAVYMTVMTWIAYFILTLGYGHPIFEAFTIPVKSSGYVRHGFDLIKICSLGIYNIDSEPTLARTFISSFVSFFIAFAIVFWHPF